MWRFTRYYWATNGQRNKKNYLEINANGNTTYQNYGMHQKQF